MEPTPRIIAVNPIQRVTFSQWVSLTRCKLKAALRSASIDGKLPEPLPTRAALVGVFHHRAMELAVQSRSAGALRDALEAEIANVQSLVSSLSHLRRLGSVSGWDEVNRSVVLAHERANARQRTRSAVAVAAETGLRSASGLLEGRPDFFSVGDSTGRLREYKSGRIRDAEGNLMSEYRAQVLFYSCLLFDNFPVESISASVESLSGDRCEITIGRLEARQFAVEVENMLEGFNRSLEGLASPGILAEPSREGCTFCSGRIVCPSFKKVQDGLELTGEQYIVQGHVVGFEKKRARCVAIVKDICRDKQAELIIPETVANTLNQDASYCFYNLARQGTGWLWGLSTRVFANV
jgi:PD-(D/E)XK nuclease superfamily